MTMSIPVIEFDDGLALQRDTGRAIQEQLDWAFGLDPVFKAMFDDARLSIAASADACEVAELIARAPTEWTAGYIAGLYVNN